MSMYKQLIESYYNYQNGEDCWYVFGSDKIVVASNEDTYCDIYENDKECFEKGVMNSIEIYDELESLDIYFDEEELEFIEEHYPDSVIADMINKLMKERE